MAKFQHGELVTELMCFPSKQYSGKRGVASSLLRGVARSKHGAVQEDNI